MTEADVEIVLQRAREQIPGAKPRMISDNGPPFIALDFKKFIRIAGIGTTSPTRLQQGEKAKQRAAKVVSRLPLCFDL